MVAPTNVGAIVHPRTTELELTRLEALLQVHIEPATVNGGVPYVASGIVANARNAVVGNLTTGPELLMLSRALGF
jgi:translation initiation factor 6